MWLFNSMTCVLYLFLYLFLFLLGSGFKGCVLIVISDLSFSPHDIHDKKHLSLKIVSTITIIDHRFKPPSWDTAAPV